MKKLIICPKASGNTYKVCCHISGNTDVNILIVNESTKIDFSDYDTIILSSGIYGGHVHKNILRLIRSDQMDSIKTDAKICLFFTWIGRGHSDMDAFNEINQLLNKKGIKLDNSYMKCFGSAMGIIRKSHPNEEDLKNVLLWVNKL
ncbi:Flavodoxin [Dethiosulfatibacter aminovorans DSM 17477]|uniref:Flavodoxin n=1 Tax=Dethiosulfatibacter aminovorans DSM 17477 TaxID=1121476 RepID=A0A1M6G9W7_9FIRM|nr:flavodoxin domain-containing protein [Dethiosulfatibacter aminovorans]SHJ06722.1 Flavodoxin [Dethiosulfatibacter aminovorans DSM 17477]